MKNNGNMNEPLSDKNEGKRSRNKRIRLIPRGLKPSFDGTTQEIPTVVAVVGGGPAGMEAAAVLSRQGCKVLLFESKSDLAGNVLNKYRLFPNFATAGEVAYSLISGLNHPMIEVYPDTEIFHVERLDIGEWRLLDQHDKAYTASAVLLASGYEVFDARRKEELGYGIYNGVITSLDLEQMLKEQRLMNTLRETPKRIVFLQCVGSRDEKVGNHYCSKVCCVTAVKQAIEVKKLSPETEVYIFYMDLRMWGQGFEELYREAQEAYNIRFVRGRISEAAATFDGKVQIKAEDTLIGQPARIVSDLLVLMVGMEASAGTRRLAAACGIEGKYGFAQSADPHLYDNLTRQQGLFVAGACKRPMSLSDAIADARSAATEIVHYLSSTSSSQVQE